MRALSLSLLCVFLAACTNEPRAPMAMSDGEVGVVASELTAAQRRVRAGQIRDAAYAAGMTQGWLLAGIADAETQMSHCWRELTWACQGPNSSDCGGGPVVAGAGDGPCSARQGGLGMFQFDAGTFDDTLRREGTRILSIAGNTQAAVDFVASMVVRSAYVSGVDTRAQAIAWMNGVRVGNGRWDAWIRTVTHYYNGCAPSYSCFSQRYAHYRDNTRNVFNEMGADFWVVPRCTPAAESCNGRDDDCDGRTDENVTRACSSACGAGTQACSGGGWGACDAPQPVAESCNGRDDDCDARTDEGDLCEVALLNEQPAAYAAPRSTDVDADGRADLCARGYGGVRCWTASASGWSAPWAAIPWSDASGWNDVTNYATLRMGDVNGDGRADVCARSNADVLCAVSSGTGFGAHTTWRAGLSDENAWNQPRYYTTLRLADVNGDGRDDLCARDRAGFGCWLSDGARFDRRIEGPRWSDESGWGAARHYGTIRMGDLDGDRRADVCARAAAGVECWRSSGDGFDTRVEGPRWSDESGWGAMRYWSTLRLVDFDGDGLGDLCARSSTDLRCVRGTGSGFGEPVIVHPMSDESGWSDIANYATLRVGDLDGDGADDLCARANAGVVCFAWDGSAFARRAGPEWSDESGWSQARHYQTMRLADFDGDGLDDVCARAGAGWRCHPSTGEGFGAAVTFDELTDAGGWVEPRYWSTILSAGHACRAETESCNGRDDDCDGEIDEHATDEICNDVDDDCDGEIDEHATDETCNERDDDCDGEVDDGLSCEPPSTGGDGGVRGDAPDGGTAAHGRVSGGCSAGGAGGGSPIALVMIAIALWAARRR
ncbi:FG-GAP repeat domain-containing protein [Sandaracinus amylolyticus]|nr:VCBS repeat-containing protein [Sandaracinus amylolyticus]